MRWAKATAAFIKAVLAEFDDDTPKVIADIRDNHLAHLNVAITDLSARIGRMEGKLAILLGVCGMILMTVLGTVVPGLLK